MDTEKKLLSVDEKIARKIERHKNFCKNCKKIWVDIGVTAATYYFEYYLGFADIENNECALVKRLTIKSQAPK